MKLSAAKFLNSMFSAARFWQARQVAEMPATLNKYRFRATKKGMKHRVNPPGTKIARMAASRTIGKRGREANI